MSLIDNVLTENFMTNPGILFLFNCLLIIKFKKLRLCVFTRSDKFGDSTVGSTLNFVNGAFCYCLTASLVKLRFILCIIIVY